MLTLFQQQQRPVHQLHSSGTTWALTQESETTQGYDVTSAGATEHV